jgi:hypothetical protein
MAVSVAGAEPVAVFVGLLWELGTSWGLHGMGRGMWKNVREMGFSMMSK